MATEQVLRSGTYLEEYRIDSVLGQGGFGVTYAAFDTHLDKRVAIKEYLPRDSAIRIDAHTVVARSDDDREVYEWGLARFLDEARTLARFEHPNLNRVHRFFETHGTAYLVLDYIDGEPLSARLARQGALPAADVERLLVEMTTALEEVHRAGYIHRDIKPGNILLRGDGTAVLADFGAARQTFAGRTRSIMTVLTPGYAPIEQYDGHGADIGPWTDLYALGMVAYRSVTGCGDADLIEANTRARRVMHGQADELPSAVAAAGRGYPSALLEAIDWAIAVDGDSRPPDAAQWRAALLGDGAGVSRGGSASGADRLGEEPPESTADGARQRVPEPTARKRGRTAALAGLAALLLVGVTLGALLLDRGAGWGSGEVVTDSGGAAESAAGGEGTDTGDAASPATPTGTVVVETGVAGAEVHLDDEALGPADESHRVPAGKHRLAVRKTGHAPYETTIEVPAGGTRKIEAVLEVLPAELIVRSNVRDDRLFIDGEAVGSTGPDPRDIEAGEHAIRVEKANHTAWRGNVELTAGERRTVRAELAPTTGELVVQANVADATVILDGDPLGPAGSGSHEVAAGEHRVRVEGHGYEPWQDTVRVAGGVIERISVSLEKSDMSQALIEQAKPEMVRIPGGTFQMGSRNGRDDEVPVHNVRVEDFYLMEHEVTFAMWDACVRAGGCSYKPDDEGWGRGSRPVINVSWEDVTGQFIPWLNQNTEENFRLPTEAEWEYAARAGSQTKYGWGNEIGRNRANCNSCGSRWDGERTAPVKSFSANEFGLYDMHGNAWEWVEDCWHDSYHGAPDDGSAWVSGGDCDDRVRRSGSWSNFPGSMRSANRQRDTAANRLYIDGTPSHGFRLAQDR